MDKALIDRLVGAMMRMRKAGDLLSLRREVSFVELKALQSLYDNRLDTDANVFAQDITEEFHMSKAAVSQMLGSLERRGYLRRDFNPFNRRKIILTLTDKGRNIVDRMERDMVEKMSAFIQDFGEEDTRLLVELFERMSEAIDRRARPYEENSNDLE